MILSSQQITAKNIVQGASPKGQRATTYDATVGEIVSCGKLVTESSFTLKSRGVAWVVSKEEFKMPDNITGIATLRTGWAHDGVFALNVGIIDPGWEGPVATALVNFGRDDFVVRKEEPFFRVFFLEVDPKQSLRVTKNVKNRQGYISEILTKSRAFSDTFLNMSSLVKEVADDVIKLPKWVLIGTWLAVFIAIVAIFAPIVFSVWVDHNKEQVSLALFEKRITALEEERKKEQPIQVAPDRKSLTRTKR